MSYISSFFYILLLIFISLPASAGIVMTGTRVIYPASQKEVTIMLKNTENIPALIQTWIDKGDPDETPEKIYVPFVLTPAVVRIDGNKGQSLRLRYTGKGLASDRESIFWLNVLAVPPKKSQMG
ncbi:MAG: molecular chaperone, partial [Flavobacterium psychrophilum]